MQNGIFVIIFLLGHGEVAGGEMRDEERVEVKLEGA